MTDHASPPPLAFGNPRVYRWYGGAAPTLAEVVAKYAPRTLAASAVRPFLILHAPRRSGTFSPTRSSARVRARRRWTC